jgi:hypothetical protein
MPGYTGCGARFPCSSRTGKQEDLRFALHSKSDITSLNLTSRVPAIACIASSAAAAPSISYSWLCECVLLEIFSEKEE